MTMMVGLPVLESETEIIMEADSNNRADILIVFCEFAFLHISNLYFDYLIFRP